MRPGYQEQILYILNKHHSIVTVELGDAVTDDILQLIDSAKREGAIEELKRNAYYSQPRKTDPLELCGIDKTADQVNDRIAQLEQSEKSE